MDTVNIFGNEMILDNCPVSKRLRKNGVYESTESHLMLNELRDDSVFLDIGAHIGYYSLLASTRIKSGEIYAFEPFPESYEKLVDNIHLNGITNITAHKAAAFNVDTEMKLFTNELNYGDNSLYENGKGNGSIVSCLRLDNLFHDKRVDFIKIDTQGAECEVLEGLRDTIKGNKIKMIIEFYPHGLKQMGHEAIELLEKLVRMGFIIFNVKTMVKMKVGVFSKLVANTKGTSHRNFYCIKGA